MSRYHVGWDLAGRRVVVVGGGDTGEGKVETLRPTGARITVVDRHLSDRLRALAAAGEIRWLRRPFRPWDVARATLVVAATGCRGTNRRVTRWAHRAGAVVNVVDDPASSDVIVHAALRRGPATIAVSTDGASPASARFLREVIEEAVPPGFGDVVAAAAQARATLRETGRYRYDYTTWRQRLLEPGLDAARRGSPAGEELRRRFLAEFERPTPLRSGEVTLVGAGPGGADLVTVAGARAIAAADVVVYDRLADPALLDLAPVAAVRVPVGKAKGGGVEQDTINRILVERAAAGERVVRLTGGDPMVFGRGGEEAAVVAAAGIPVRVIPGVSSALAAPALAGIPVTDRRAAGSVVVLTGHRLTGNQQHDWGTATAGVDTVVVLMAASAGQEVGRALLGAGRPGDEPVAAIHQAGRPTARLAITDVAGLASAGSPFPSPTVLVIGEVVRLRTDPAAADEPSLAPGCVLLPGVDHEVLGE